MPNFFIDCKNTTQGELKQIAINLQSLDKVAQDPEFLNEIGIRTTQDLRQKIVEANATEWGEGKQGSASEAIGDVYYALTKRGVSVYWNSEYNTFLEYGAGIKGAEAITPELAAYAAEDDYMPTAERPRNTGHDKFWIVDPEKTSGEKVISFGWQPYAPFYNAVILGNKYYFAPKYGKLFGILVAKHMRRGARR